MKFLRNAATVSGLTAASRVLGLAREILMANVFGTSLVKSAFDLAFRIPNLFRAIFGEGALTQAFLPRFTAARVEDGIPAANAYSGKVLTVLTATLCTITAICVVAIQLIRPWMTPGSSPETVLRLLAILFPYMIFLCLVAACACILNSVGRFALPAAAPVLLNIVWIVALLVIIPRMPESLDARITLLAWAIVGAGVLQLAFLIIPLARSAFRPALSFAWNDTRLQQTFRAFIPAAAASGIRDINSLIDGVLALWIGAWAPATLVFAERLAFLPIGLFATALGTVLLPELAELRIKDPTTMRKTLQQAINASLLIMLPATAALLVLATPLIQLIYERGAFDAESTRLTSRALMAYAPGLISFSIFKMILSAFHAQNDTRTPMYCMVGAVLTNICLNLLFIVILPPDWRHAGLAAATVLASVANTAALAIILHRRIHLPDWKALAQSTLRIALCAAAMVWVLRYAPRLLPRFDLTTKFGQLLNMAILITIGMTTYALALLLLCRKDIRALLGKR